MRATLWRVVTPRWNNPLHSYCVHVESSHPYPPAEELLRPAGRVVAEAVRGGDDEAVVDEAAAAPALLPAHLYPRHPRPHVHRDLPLHYLKAVLLGELEKKFMLM